jgi:peptide/nickel transport system permease protein
MTRKPLPLWSVLPVVALFLGSLLFVCVSSRSPSRLVLDMSWSSPSAARPLGSGDAGVDLLALICHAAFRAMLLSITVSLWGFAVGTPLGALAGIAGGGLERRTLRACDLVQAFPTFLLALAVLSAVSVPSRLHIGFVFALTAWAPFARVAAAQARALREAQFVQAARALGVSRTRTLFGHVLPNLMGPVSVQIGTSAAGVVLGETALGFVGLGPPDGVSLGAALEQGSLAMLRAPHVLAAAVSAIALVNGALQLASEGLRQWVHRGQS